MCLLWCIDRTPVGYPPSPHPIHQSPNRSRATPYEKICSIWKKNRRAILAAADASSEAAAAAAAAAGGADGATAASAATEESGGGSSGRRRSCALGPGQGRHGGGGRKMEVVYYSQVTEAKVSTVCGDWFNAVTSYGFGWCDHGKDCAPKSFCLCKNALFVFLSVRPFISVRCTFLSLLVCHTLEVRRSL